MFKENGRTIKRYWSELGLVKHRNVLLKLALLFLTALSHLTENVMIYENKSTEICLDNLQNVEHGCLQEHSRFQER